MQGAGSAREVAHAGRRPPASGTRVTNSYGSAPSGVPFGLAAALAGLLGPNPPVAIECYDGSRLGPPDATTRIIVRSENAARYVLSAPGELGFARAYVAGEIDVEGDIFEALQLRDRLPDVRVTPREWLAVARATGINRFRRVPVPPEEVRIRGRRHSKARDAAAISHHYDVSNRFYELVIGPSMTYSCAVFAAADMSLEDAQAAKYDLVARKLGLRPGMRMLDVGCGWGGMAMYAARHYGVDAVGVTLSSRQADYAMKAVAEAGLADRVQIRVQDYRDVHDGPFDAISSIGMFEHVGLSRLDEYFVDLFALLQPRGRLLNHGIARLPGRSRLARRGFMQRYVFPDGELHEVGVVASRIQRAGFEVRHVEGLREHYSRTLRHWVANLESNWDAAVAEVGSGRARVWRLYMAASACSFEAARTQIHQVLAVKNDPAGHSGLPLRPDWGA